MSEPTEDICNRCGEQGAGTRKFMFYRWYETFPRPPVAREFFCFRCQRVMRVYAIIGFTLLGCLVLAILVATLWVMSLSPSP